MYSDRTGTDRNHPGQNIPNKTPSDKPPGQKPPRTILTEFIQRGFCLGFFVLDLLNIGGFWDMWRTFGGSGMCDEVWLGEGGKNWPKIAWRTLWTAPNNFSLTRLTSAMTGWFPTLSRPPFDPMGAETRGYWYTFPKLLILWRPLLHLVSSFPGETK